MVVAYTLNNPPSRPFTFRARVPDWAGSATLRVNNQEAVSSNAAGLP